MNKCPGVLRVPGLRAYRIGANMVMYRRNFVPGGTYFFTLTLADRRSSLLIDHIDLLCYAYQRVVAARGINTVAICILPDHLHAI
jgi:putative transposase